MDQLEFHHILALLAGTVAASALFRRLRLPPVLAYLVAGVVLGPWALSVIPDAQGTRYLAEFGLVFLMLTVGLEFSLSQLIAMRRAVLGFGGAQVLVSCALFAALARAFGVPLESALVIGGVLAMSSTAIVMKLLLEQLEQNSRHGRLAFAIALFQDLIVVPFLILIPALGADAQGALGETLLWALIKSVAVLALFVLAGRWLLRPLFHWVAAMHSRELFVLTVLLVVLSSAWLTGHAGLSLALGALLAGVMIGETEYRHQVEGDILPFRDILLGLFFVSTGMSLNLPLVFALWPALLGLLAALVFGKIVVIVVLGRLFRIEAGVALRTALVLAQGGEFGFVLLLQATQFNVLDPQTAQLVLAAITLSMVLAPVLVHYNGAIAKRLLPSYGERRESNLQMIRGEAQSTHPQVIVCGYGRSGQNLTWMLEHEGMRVLALDLDPVRVREARDAGEPVVYGDAARSDVLLAAGLKQARALAVTFYDTHNTALRILEITRGVRPDMPVIVRTRDDGDLERLTAAGATEVVPESLEGSLMIASHVLLLLGVPVSQIVRRVREVRQSRYRMLRGFFHGQEPDGEDGLPAYYQRLHAATLPEGAYAAGRMLADLHLERLGVDVTAVRRGGIRGPEPAPDTQLQAGDVLVLYGTPEALDQAQKILLRGRP